MQQRWLPLCRDKPADEALMGASTLTQLQGHTMSTMSFQKEGPSPGSWLPPPTAPPHTHTTHTCTQMHTHHTSYVTHTHTHCTQVPHTTEHITHSTHTPCITHIYTHMHTHSTYIPTYNIHTPQIHLRSLHTIHTPPSPYLKQIYTHFSAP